MNVSGRKYTLRKGPGWERSDPDVSQQSGQDGEARRKVKGDGRKKIRRLKVPKAAIKTRLSFHRR